MLPVLTNVAPSSLHRKAVTDNMLQIIKAHAKWLVHADGFEHPCPQLASQHPIWSDMASVDTTTCTQWREDWSLASVVNHSVITDPTIQKPGFNLPRLTHGRCSTISRQGKTKSMQFCTNRILPDHLPVIVASDRP